MRPKSTAALIAALAALALLAWTPQAAADEGFGLKNLAVSFEEEGGSPAINAGSHPYSFTTTIDFNTTVDPDLGVIPIDAAKDIQIDLPPGLVADPSAVPTCPATVFLASADGHHPTCPNATVVGLSTVEIGTTSPGPWTAPVYNMTAPRGAVLKFGFIASGVPVTFEAGLRPTPPYNGFVTIANIPQAVNFYGSKTTIWGNPFHQSHDALRGTCLDGNGTSKGNCPVSSNQRPFVLMPRSCQGPLPTTFAARSWQLPANWLLDTVHSPELGDCASLPFAPEISAKPTSKAATSPSGLDFGLEVSDEGLTSSKEGSRAASDIEKTVVTLPQGFSVNPSLAEGLAACSPADFARETLQTDFGAGCPAASKIGTIAIESPLLEGQILSGSLFVATPYENPFDSLIALYVVIRDPQLGVFITQALHVQADPVTGQLTTTADDIPQLPFSHFRLHFREGTRSPLVTPPACGTYEAKAVLYPWAGGPPVTSTSAFQIISGPDNGPCPAGGLPPFHPELVAGTLNNAAGAFSPFNVKLTRSDAEQEITHFSIKLPPGVAGKLAGIPLCPDAAIARAQSRTGPHGGQEELDDPSCPAASQLGRTLAGSGVGPSLAYAPGKIYLAGPYHGAPISFVAITSGVVGPFDIGTVVVRLAIDVDPETGEVFLDSTGSDPIPHIIKGIPVHLRDIRAYTDRPEFTFNPTSCEPMSTSATVLGSGLDFASPADDNPFVSTSRFQAADCAALPFKPKITFRLKGGTKRGDHPSLRAHVKMAGFGEAGIARTQVTLPHSEFLEQGHIGTVCTRVQFNSGLVPGENCPAASVYGRARAVTPILDGALQGPIYLRSSEHELPDLVAAFHHAEIDITLVGRIDSVRGQIRNTFEAVPDAPVTSADFIFGAGKKSLLVNSTDICKGKHKVLVNLEGQNGKQVRYRTALKAKCGRSHK